MNLELIKKAFVVLAQATFTFCITACNTMEGAGKDIEKGGEKIQDAAD